MAWENLDRPWTDHYFYPDYVSECEVYDEGATLEGFQLFLRALEQKYDNDIESIQAYLEASEKGD